MAVGCWLLGIRCSKPVSLMTMLRE
jgi:hypothetical protein